MRFAVGFRIPDSGFRISDFGFLIPDFEIWNLEFGIRNSFHKVNQSISFLFLVKLKCMRKGAYRIVAWLGWVPNLLIAEMYIRLRTFDQ